MSLTIATSAALPYEQEVRPAIATGPSSNVAGTSIEKHEQGQQLLHEGNKNHLRPSNRLQQSENSGELLQ